MLKHRKFSKVSDDDFFPHHCLKEAMHLQTLHFLKEKKIYIHIIVSRQGFAQLKTNSNKAIGQTISKMSSK